MICPHGHDEGMVERRATPEEVDAGSELAIAFDPCPECNPVRVGEDGALTLKAGWKPCVPPPCPPETFTLLGVPDFDEDFQAEHGQGPPA